MEHARTARTPVVCAAVIAALAAIVTGGCDGTSGQADGTDASVGASTDGSTDAVELAQPVPDVDAATRAFQLYYSERLDRAAIAYNRFVMVGGTDFGVTIGRTAVTRTGDAWELVPGPNDNNMIGITVWATWHAYKATRSRTLALSLVRMFEGLAFYEAISGHPGVTSRMVYPGWTRVVDGPAGEVTLTRDGLPTAPPQFPAPELHDELVATFWGDGVFTYRENPAEWFFSFDALNTPDQYAVTHSFSALPDYLRVSDCCTSLKQTPEPYPWAGAFWGNHNSRDNFPDLALGIVAAMEAADDPDAAPEVRAAAAHAVEAGRRIGDLVAEHGGALVTADEHNPYETLVVAGAVRPDGETEAEDLGSMSACPMAFLAQAISSEGLAEPLPSLPLPGSVEFLLVGTLAGAVECEIPQGVRHCERLEEAYCGLDWSEMDGMKIFGQPWLDAIEEMDRDDPGVAQELIGGFQDDYYEVTLAMVALVEYARITGQTELHSRSQGVLADLTELMRRFADTIYTRTNPGQLTHRQYEAALFDAAGGLEPIVEHLGDFAGPEGQLATIESQLQLADTALLPLLTDEELATKITSHLAGRSETVKARYAAEYGDEHPIRRKGDTYEARGTPLEDHPWTELPAPRFANMGAFKLAHAAPLCSSAPDLLDCTWAAAGCARADLDGDGVVGPADRDLLEAQAITSGCEPANAWCEGADLDRTGAIDDRDEAFMTAAEGCWYTPPG